MFVVFSQYVTAVAVDRSTGRPTYPVHAPVPVRVEPMGRPLYDDHRTLRAFVEKNGGCERSHRHCRFL
ncbi:hypothetical protein C446_11967 [Halobiforma nitratireducens JCM 10879]|uniref:Uncharacterized protein n=1 Tax=Halobiforma nitratireducens JCM 10879 TaxID=1227454 RepID=M0LV92_9EURY|nr:hypothetical protein C446_11967 [Halobiforma nitratireducens JCM 10879]